MKRVEVIWRDIIHEVGWHDESEAKEYFKKNTNVRQVGYLYSEDEHHLHIIDSYFESGDHLGVIYKIPKGCIVSITEI